MQVDKWDVPWDAVADVPCMNSIHVVQDSGVGKGSCHGGYESLQYDEGNGGTLRFRHAVLVTENMESEEACAVGGTGAVQPGLA